MIKPGEYQQLIIKREMPQGFYLEDDEGNEVLMPRKYLTRKMRIDDPVEVFVYPDAEGLLVATTESPVFTVGQFALIKVKAVASVGAFCDWGITKDLFIPYRNQLGHMYVDQKYVVYLYVDEKSDRLVGTTKLHEHLEHKADETLKMGQEVEVIVYDETDLGYKVVVNQKFSGLMYKNELKSSLRYGQSRKGYIKPIREDGKIDVSAYPVGYQSIEPNAEKILKRLQMSNGFLPLTDKSDPKLIMNEFGISKKLFKKSLGALYRDKLVELKPDGIYLLNEGN